MKKNFKDLTGVKFEKGFVKEIVGKSSNGSFKWMCICNCGEEFVARADRIQPHKFDGSCPKCNFKKKGFEIEDLRNFKFKNNGYVKELTDSDKFGNAVWICVCECKKEFKAKASDIRSGRANGFCKKCNMDARDFRNIHDLTGVVYDNGTIVEKISQLKPVLKYLVKCYCGESYEVVADVLNGWEPKIRCDKCVDADRLRGKDHPCWNHEKTDEERAIDRKYPEYKEWHSQILKRDNYRCKVTGRNKNLQVHHLKNYSQYPELRTDIDNGVTLTENIHDLFHQRYGIKNNTPAQFEEFKLLFTACNL